MAENHVRRRIVENFSTPQKIKSKANIVFVIIYIAHCTPTRYISLLKIVRWKQ